MQVRLGAMRRMILFVISWSPCDRSRRCHGVGLPLPVDARLSAVLLLPVLVYVVTVASMVATSRAKIAQAQRWAVRMNAEAAAYLEGQPVVRVFGGAAASQPMRSSRPTNSLPSPATPWPNPDMDDDLLINEIPAGFLGNVDDDRQVVGKALQGRAEAADVPGVRDVVNRCHGSSRSRRRWGSRPAARSVSRIAVQSVEG